MFFFKNKVKEISEDEAVEANELRDLFDYPCNRIAEIDFNTIVDNLYDAQVLIAFTVITEAQGSKVDLGPNVRAGLINTYIKKLSNLKKENLITFISEIEKIRIDVKNYYNLLKNDAVKNPDLRTSIHFYDLLAVLWEVKFKFDVPKINF